MSNLIPHVPMPDFWKKYYLAQARGEGWARASPNMTQNRQKGRGRRTTAQMPVKVISPVQAANERAASQVKRRLEDVGGVDNKKRKTIKGRGQSKKRSSSNCKRRVKKTRKTKSKKNIKKRGIYSVK